MFKKLKTRLMLLNLAIAGIILVAISIMAYILISNNVEMQSRQTFQMLLNSMVTQQNAVMPPTLSIAMKEKDGVVMPVYPYYIINIDANQGAFVTVTSPLSPGIVGHIVQSVLESQDRLQNNMSITNSNGDTIKMLSFAGGEDTVRSGGTSYRYGAVYSTSGNIQIVIQDLSSDNELLENIGVILVICVAGGLVLLAFGGRYLAERSIRPIRESWQKQREFVADASHELRTPLAAILSNIEVVQDDPEATVREKQVYCQGIAEESKRMTQLVDGLLLLARADSDALVLRRETVNTAELAQNAAALMQPAAAKKGIEISLHTNAKPDVDGDPDRLKQVLLQLLDNAVKYTPEGGHIEICVGLAKDRAVIRVADDGIGIAKELLEKIFERFYRVDTSREREVGGHGLGLSIARFIVEQHGGAISAASEAQGSVFTVSLPAKIK